ncbi:MAG: hypothetical protein JXB85_12960 [Anaerolineales bacterium]|nr:hypothetical protein [Anaerolineales bacterium]
MNKDFKSWMMILVFGLPLFLILFLAALYFGNCGFGQECGYSNLPEIIHTPIPTLLPASLPTPQTGPGSAAATRCTVQAETLLAAWVNAGVPERQPFAFTDVNGIACQATFADLQPLFAEGNLWYTGAVACTTCHNSTLSAAAAGMDLSDYTGILAGSRRASLEASGNDILGGGDWAASKLNEQLFVLEKMPFGRPQGAVPAGGPTLLAGEPLPEP